MPDYFDRLRCHLLLRSWYGPEMLHMRKRTVVVSKS